MRCLRHILCGALLALGAGEATAAGHTMKSATKTGILLVTFGTSIPEAAVAFDNIAKRAADRFPGTPVRWAYTARIIRRKLARGGKQIDSPSLALARMHDEGFTHVAVQSLHVIAGAEYDELAETVQAFGDGPNAFRQIVIGLPLLASLADLERVAGLVLAALPAERQAGDAVVLMGHGSEHHPADLAYTAAASVVSRMDALAFLGTVEGHPTLEDVLAQCKSAKVTKAYLVPFMSVAGDHARNDLAGDEEDSWKSVLEKAGIACVPVLRGMAENDAIVDVWLDHLAEKLEILKAD